MTPLQLLAPVTLKATAGKPRRFKILAYTGGQLAVSGFDLPVVVDLKGLEAGAVSLILDHKATTETTIGQVAEIHNDGRTLRLAGTVTGQSAQVQQVLAQADAGHQWQASIGAMVGEQERIQAGQTVVVNGQRFVGPLIVARRAVLRETSVLPVGADAGTQVNLAAAAVGLQQRNDMSFEQWLTNNGFDNTTLSDASRAYLQKQYDAEINAPAGAAPVAAAALVDLRADRAAEHQRIAQIERIATGFPHVAAKAIQAGWTPVETENAVMKEQLRMQHVAPRYSTTAQEPDSAQVLAASFAMTTGGKPDFLAKHYGEQVIDAASRAEHRGATLRTVMDAVLRAAGVPSPSHRTNSEYIRAAFTASQKLEASGLSTVGIPGILGNAANKLLLQGFMMVPTTWQEFCARGDLKDFKEATRYRMVTGGQFEEVGKGGTIKHLNLIDEETYTVQARTYAAMLSLDRQTIVNDDLGAFDALPTSIGRLGALRLEREVYTKLLSNTGSFFAAGNDNYLSGGGSALSITALTAAEKLFLQRTDGNGDPIMLVPELLMVPPTLSVSGNQLVRDTQVVAIGVGASAAVTPDSNPHGGKFKLIVPPWLEIANITNHSTTGWYLLARPQGSSGLLEVGFLNGQETPTIETGELDFAQLGMSLRGYWDFGVAYQDGRFGVFNAGA